MNESIKAILGVIIAGCVLFGIIAWMPFDVEQGSFMAWSRVLCPLLAVICLVPLIWAQTRKNKAPDFLAHVSSRYFERDGLCFAITPHVEDSECSMHIFYQNRYSKPCFAQILIRSSSSLFNGRADLSDIRLGISCGPGDFGCSSIPWAIPKNLQGREVSLSLYAGVRYPDGRGTMLRYRDGLRVGSVGTDLWREGLQIAGAMTGALVISRPARIKVKLPIGVNEVTDKEILADKKILWSIGDPA